MGLCTELGFCSHGGVCLILLKRKRLAAYKLSIKIISSFHQLVLIQIIFNSSDVM